MGELANCSTCGTLFVSNGKDICQKCFREEEAAFEKVYQYVSKRKNREATIPQITEATGVEEDLIIKFVKENRLRPSQFPNLYYACERCGTAINEGKLCATCSNELTSDVRRQKEIDDIAKQNEVREKKASHVYFNYNNTRK